MGLLPLTNNEHSSIDVCMHVPFTMPLPQSCADTPKWSSYWDWQTHRQLPYRLYEAYPRLSVLGHMLPGLLQVLGRPRYTHFCPRKNWGMCWRGQRSWGREEETEEEKTKTNKGWHKTDKIWRFFQRFVISDHSSPSYVYTSPLPSPSM